MEENFNKLLIVISILLALILLCDGTKIECSKDSPTINNPEFKDTPFPRPEQVKLGDNYEISLRYTNWITSETAKFVEQSVNGSTVISKTTPKSVTTLYRGVDRKLYVETNMTHDNVGQVCTGAPTESQMNIYGLSPTFAKFLNGSNSFVSILESIIFDTHQFNRTFLDNSTNITAGVETVSWVGCARGVSNTTNNVQIDVYFAGDKTLQQPYNGNFHNPQVMTIHLQIFQEEQSKDNTTKINVIEHISFDLVTLDTVDPMQKDTILMPPRGLFCTDLPKVECPHDLPSRFVAQMEYTDSVNNAKDDIEVLYDESEHIFSISMDFQPNSDVPLLGNTFLAGPTKVIHDFNYGLQYVFVENFVRLSRFATVLSRDGSVCQGVEPIDTKMGDVGKGPNGTLTMRSAAEMLFNLTGQEFYYAGKVRAEENNMLLVSYVTRKVDSNGNEVVIEMLYREEAWSANGPQKPNLHCITQYHRKKTGEIVRRSTIRINALISNNEGVSILDYGVFQCLRNYDGNRIFFLSLENVAMEDVSKAGFTRVKSALARTIAHSANVSVLRLSNLMFTQQGSEMLACFMIGEKSDVKSPAKTAYFHEELSVDAARRALNRTINATDGLTVKIPALGPKQPALSFTSKKFGLLPNHNMPSPQPAYIGYSGQAMFVMAVFMFTFGITAVIGSYVFYVKRQSIRGMAYQVFE
ncbi:hypothetical protein DdX_09088 [Ditylenchus destructor]|uniref:Uncharacterized protein n=1 Tax=Ditylenchus destructor TaxID=166010 RepID=A0AAD4R6R9_9BILA|nr:hypothetical protein DdX_09088 [Ditylenchus destructor]